MKVLVTGCCGYIGRALVPHLQALGHDVHGIDLDTGHDVRDPSNIDFQAEAVVHLAAMSGVTECQNDPAGCIETNVIGTARMIEYAHAVGAKRFVFASSGAVYGECHEPASVTTPRNPLSWYGTSKVLGEKLLEREDGLVKSILRLGNVIGGDPFQGRIVPTLLRCAERGEEFHARGLDCVRSYIPLGNVLYEFSGSLSDESSLVENIGGEAASVREVVQAVEAVTGKRIKVVEKERSPWEPEETAFAGRDAFGLIYDLISDYVAAQKVQA